MGQDHHVDPLRYACLQIQQEAGKFFDKVGITGAIAEIFNSRLFFLRADVGNAEPFRRICGVNDESSAQPGILPDLLHTLHKLRP